MQEYVRELAICVALGGPRMRMDLASSTGRRLAGLIAEVSNLCAAKATADFQSYRTFAGGPMLPAPDSSQAPDDGNPSAESSVEPDWLELAVRKPLPLSCSCLFKQLWIVCNLRNMQYVATLPAML